MLKVGMGNKGKFGPLRIAAGFGGILCAAGQSEEAVERRTPAELCVEIRIALAHDATPFHEAILPDHSPHTESTGYSDRNLEPERR